MFNIRCVFFRVFAVPVIGGGVDVLCVQFFIEYRTRAYDCGHIKIASR